MMLLSLTTGLLPPIGPSMLLCEEVSSPKTIKIKLYFSTTHFSVNNRHFVIKSSQTTQLYITKVFDKRRLVLIV
jgi:hypothetical protein